MMTLKEKKQKIFEFLKDRPFKCNLKEAKWLESLGILDFYSSPEESCKFGQRLELIDGMIMGSGESIGKSFEQVQKFIQKTLLQDTYIHVKSPEESKWVQELLFSVGYGWSIYKDKIRRDVSSISMFKSGELGDLLYQKYQIDIPYLETLFDTKFEVHKKPSKKWSYMAQEKKSQRIMELEADVERLQSLVRGTSEKLYERDQQIEKLNQKIDSLTGNLGSVVADLELHKKIRASQASMISEKEGTIRELKAAVDMYQKTVKKKDSAIVEWANELAELKNENKRLHGLINESLRPLQEA